MIAQISEEILNVVKEMERTNANKRIPVIITFMAGTLSNSSILEDEGLHIDTHLASIDAISGTIPASRVNKVAQHPFVKSIEYDGEVRALI